MSYSKAQIKGAKKRIMDALTGCYAGETRVSYHIKSEECNIARGMAARLNSQIEARQIEGNYQYFAPKEDTFIYKGFKWNRY